MTSGATTRSKPLSWLRMEAVEVLLDPLDFALKIARPAHQVPSAEAIEQVQVQETSSQSCHTGAVIQSGATESVLDDEFYDGVVDGVATGTAAEFGDTLAMAGDWVVLGIYDL